MRIELNQKNLKRALSLVERVASRSVTLPILSNVILKTEAGRLKIEATNLEIGITCVIGAKIEEPGEIAVPARIISDFIANLNEENLSLHTKQNNLFITTKNHKTQILGFNTKEYPIIPKIKDGPTCQVAGIALRTALLSVVDSIALSEARPELSGLYIRFTQKEILCAATDSFRLVEKKLTTPCVKMGSVIIPRNTVTELIRILGDLDGNVEIRIGENQISFSNGDVELISRLIDGTYPDYTKVIPEKTLSKILTSREELEQHTKLASLFSSTISDITFQCGEDGLTVLSRNSDRGELQAHLDGILKGDPFSLSVNYHYLLDGLKVIKSEKIILEFTGAGSPLVLRPAEEQEQKTFLYLLMPLRN